MQKIKHKQHKIFNWLAFRMGKYNLKVFPHDPENKQNEQTELKTYVTNIEKCGWKKQKTKPGEDATVNN